MTQYLISFGAHAMDHIPDEDAPAVARAAHAAVQEVINAGVYVSAGGLEHQPASIVATDGAVTDGPYPEAIGGFTLVTCPHARRRCSGLPRSPSPAAARKRSGRSGPTPNSTRCSARLIADGDVPVGCRASACARIRAKEFNAILVAAPDCHHSASSQAKIVKIRVECARCCPITATARSCRHQRISTLPRLVSSGRHHSR
jgi:hypothetical protein